VRVSSPTLDGCRDEAVALDELLERIEELGDAYGPELLGAVEPWVERARTATSSNASEGELRRVRDGIEQTLLSAACAHADALLAEHAPRIDALMEHAALLGGSPDELAAVIIDARSPDVPGALCARPWPVSIEKRNVLARDLESAAPNTAAALRARHASNDQDVVVVTLGRVMRTTRTVRAYGEA